MNAVNQSSSTPPSLIKQMVSASAGHRSLPFSLKECRRGLLENYNLVLAFLYCSPEKSSCYSSTHGLKKTLLVNLPSMLTKGLFSTLLSYPAKELSYFFTLQSVILPAFVTLPTTSCQTALYSCSTFHTPQSLQTPPCIMSSSPSINNW